MNRIGTVELLRMRIYPLDAESHDEYRSEVVVEPGSYALYQDGISTFWMMRGKLNKRGIRRLGDGAFSMQTSDSPSEIAVMFSSQRFGPDEWAQLLAGPECTDGPQKRLHVTLAPEPCGCTPDRECDKHYLDGDDHFRRVSDRD